MAWMYLVIAGLFEIVWAVGLKYTEGFTKTLPSFITISAMLFSLWFLSLSLKELPMGTAYAIWTGIGTIGTALFGILIFSEPATALRVLSLLMILFGIFGLKLVT